MKQPSMSQKSSKSHFRKSEATAITLVVIKVTTCFKYIFIYIKFQKESKMLQA